VTDLAGFNPVTLGDVRRKGQNVDIVINGGAIQVIPSISKRPAGFKTITHWMAKFGRKWGGETSGK